MEAPEPDARRGGSPPPWTTRAAAWKAPTATARAPTASTARTSPWTPPTGTTCRAWLLRGTPGTRWASGRTPGTDSRRRAPTTCCPCSRTRGRTPARRPIGKALDGQGGPFTHGFNHFLFAETTDGTPASTAGKKAAAEKTTASKSAAESAGGKKATTAKPAAKKTASRKRSA